MRDFTLRRMRESARRFLHDDSGATVIEYTLLVVIIAMAIIAAIGGVGDSLGGNWDEINDDVIDALEGAGVD